mmetsp:Transcript_31184/g.70172  ORF Transcript_31184/g.70172 Transcript_31184/m.70172 type:complete len:129 (-) Transcript_31184:125-511(-)
MSFELLLLQLHGDDGELLPLSLLSSLTSIASALAFLSVAAFNRVSIRAERWSLRIRRGSMMLMVVFLDLVVFYLCQTSLVKISSSSLPSLLLCTDFPKKKAISRYFRTCRLLLCSSWLSFSFSMTLLL